MIFFDSFYWLWDFLLENLKLKKISDMSIGTSGQIYNHGGRHFFSSPLPSHHKKASYGPDLINLWQCWPQYSAETFFTAYLAHTCIGLCNRNNTFRLMAIIKQTMKLGRSGVLQVSILVFLFFLLYISNP